MYFDQIRLESKEYPISRTVVLPEECTLAFLHLVIQRVFGWLDYHLYEFTDAKGTRYIDPTDEGSGAADASREVDATTVSLRRLFKERGDTLGYEYDFGDCNELTIIFLKRVKADHMTGFSSYFESKGPTMVEDSRGLGGEGGVCLVAGRHDQGSRCLGRVFKMSGGVGTVLPAAFGRIRTSLIASWAVGRRK